jgi:hypothetical protein
LGCFYPAFWRTFRRAVCLVFFSYDKHFAFRRLLRDWAEQNQYVRDLQSYVFRSSWFAPTIYWSLGSLFVC